MKTKITKKEKIDLYNRTNVTLRSELRNLLYPFSPEYQSKLLEIVDNLRANDEILRGLKK